MKNYLDNLPKDIDKLINLASRVARKQGVRAYLVGGVVRDLILGVDNFDLDIVIEGDGLAFGSELARKVTGRLVTHPRFGTATLMISNKIKLDIATCRSEIYQEPGSLPLVSAGALQDDLARRDFTINTLAIDLMPDRFGSLIDFYHGKRDLKLKFVRILHNLSFIDDPTRILRAVRFEQRLGFRIEPHTLRLLKESAKANMLRCVSPHRLRDEIILMLREPEVIRCILRMKQLVGFNFIHPHIKLDRSNLDYLRAVKREINWFYNNFPKGRELDVWLMYFVGIVSNLNANQVDRICKRFGFRKGEIKRIISYYKFSRQKVKCISKKDISPSQIYRILEPLSFETILLIKAKYKNRFLDSHIKNFFEYYNGARVYISGRDLTQIGLRPSPDFRKILTRLLYLQLDGKINSRQEALEWISRFC